MFSDTPLIVIDEYPAATSKPFVNPICKDTYDALPKIYGRKGKKRFLFNLQDIVKQDHIGFQRDCCCHAEAQRNYRPPSDIDQKRKVNMSLNLGMAMPRSENCKKKTCTCNKGVERVEVQEEGGENAKPQPRLQKIILPHLRQIDDIKEAESKHKVCQLGTNPSLDSNRPAESRLLLESRHQRLKQLRQSKVSRSEYIQTEPQKPIQLADTQPIDPNIKQTLRETVESKAQLQTPRKKRYQSQANDETKPYYQYLENDPRLKQQSDKSTRGHQHNLRRSNTNEDEALSISSFTMKNQQSASTIFHQFKKKQSSRNSTQQPSIHTKLNNNISNLNNNLFKIPQPKDYESFLSNYTPLNPEFDLKQLIKRQNFHIVPGEGFVYFGEIVGQKKHGQGILVSDKEVFEGRYEQNAKSVGWERNREGVYTGEFARGRRCGKGRFVWNNGEQFQGEWKDGRKNGWGTWRSPRGDYYEGEWRDNRQNGKGYFLHFGGSKYRGYFRDFLKHGKGEEQFNNGDKYNGAYELGKPHGYGRYSWANGDIYEGDFVEGSREGHGVLRRADGQVYEGEFKNDAKHGQGHEKYKSGEQFVGEFREGERLKGKLRTKNGTEIAITSD